MSALAQRQDCRTPGAFEVTPPEGVSDQESQESGGAGRHGQPAPADPVHNADYRFTDDDYGEKPEALRQMHEVGWESDVKLSGGQRGEEINGKGHSPEHEPPGKGDHGRQCPEDSCGAEASTVAVGQRPNQRDMVASAQVLCHQYEAGRRIREGKACRCGAKCRGHVDGQ